MLRKLLNTKGSPTPPAEPTIMSPTVSPALPDEQQAVVPEQGDDTPKAAEDVMAEDFSTHGDRTGSGEDYVPGEAGDRPGGGIGTHNRADTQSVVGPSLVVKGELEAAEDLLIEGRLEGSIKHTAEHLIIGKEGVVNADIHARNLSIEGVVEGNIVGSESVVIHDTANVRGNIYTPRISISDGAHFIGSIDMDTSNAQKH